MFKKTRVGNRLETTFPVNFTHAELSLTGTTPEGVPIQIKIDRVKFEEDGDISLVEIEDFEPSNVDPRFAVNPHKQFRLEFKGLLESTDPNKPAFEVSVSQPEDMERLIVKPTATPTGVWE